LDNCAAIELFKYNDVSRSRLVIRASNNYSCTLDFAMTPGACDDLLKGLSEIALLS
jgi:hypothetical protein